MRRSPLSLLVCLVLASAASADDLPVVTKVTRQPLAAHAKVLTETADFLGVPFSAEIKASLEKAATLPDDEAVKAIQTVLDPLCIAMVEINPEARAKVLAGPAKPELVEQGWRMFLVKVHNQAGLTAELKVDSPQAIKVFAQGEPVRQKITEQMIADRWLDTHHFIARPLQPKLSGLEVEYRIFQFYSRDTGKRQANLTFSAGQGTQDLGFRSEVNVLFTAVPAIDVKFKVHDDDGRPAMASLTVKDATGRVYPYQNKRLAPDFFFHAQVYRFDGESIKLPPGKYTVESTRGPEYVPSTQNITVGHEPMAVDIKLNRWIDPAKFGYWSGDHHIHAAGCAHYTQPSEGVHAKDMMRHILGEDLKVGCNLTWGPCFDYQKQFFTGKDDAVSQKPYILRYDIEVSGFGSHRSGHLCLLRLKDQIPPGGGSKEHWPTLGLNTLKWAKKQGAVTGPAHSGSGISVKDNQLPSYVVPNYDGIGANEFVVDITHEVDGPDGKKVPAVDFISTVDTDPKAELNMWYHSLNCGYRIRASGETDFPCIYGERVGMGRSYVKLDKELVYEDWCEGIRQGTNYVSDGKSHIMSMKLNDAEMGVKGSELKMTGAGTAKLTAKVAAYLPKDARIAPPGARMPVWDIERARVRGSRNVDVELIVNAQVVEKKSLVADGTIQDLAFDVKLDRSSWVALRIFPSSHSNPIFVVMDGKPIRASRKSAQWCLSGVDQCWSQKQRFYDADEMEDAKAAYNHALEAYKKILGECEVD